VVKLARPSASAPRRPPRPRAGNPAPVAGRRERQQARTREEILLAAARALARSGHKAVSMSDIAAEVGFTAPALYAYFASKESIFSALVQLLGQEIAETFVTPPRGLPFREKLRLLVREALTWADRRRELLLALVALKMRGLTLPCPPEPSPGHLSWDLYTPRVAEWLRQAGRRSRELAGHDPQEAACVLVGIMHGFFLRWLADSAGPTTRLAEQSDRIVDFFLYGLSGGAAHA
jgi:AcrR family transcriptional regulator